MPQPLPAHRAIVVVDVAGFTNPVRTMAHQFALHEGLYTLLREAFAESGIDWSVCAVEDRGDGAMILVPPEIPKILLADRLPNRLVAGLRRYNAVHAPEAAVQLRVGLHAGEILENANGVVSRAVNDAFRILDASEAKSALASSDGVLAFIASDRFYQDVIVHDPAADAGSYRRISVAVKGFSSEAWLRLDGAAPISQEKAASIGSAPRVDPPDEVLDLLPSRDLERLHGLLSEINVPQLPTFVRRAAGPAVPVPRRPDAWDVFSYLAEFNAGPDGLPPALLFLELLAGQVGGEVSATLTEWVSSQVRRLRLERVLRARQDSVAPIPVTPRLHLLVVIEPDGIDPNRFLLSAWRQDDPDEWPPARSDIREVTVDELERRVDELVLAAERGWVGHGGTVALEFLLPRALLHLPVHRWHKEHESPDPRPLCLDYPIVLRSLDRMRSSHWHRVWHDRFRTLLEDPSASRVLFGRPSGSTEQLRIDAVLSDPQWVSMVLAEAPSPEPRPGSGLDELTAALRSGIPALIWHPTASPHALREIVNSLLDDDGLADLPGRVHSARRTAFLPLSTSDNVNLARDLVVLWDDPRRLVVLGQSPGPLRPQRNTADERERASR